MSRKEMEYIMHNFPDETISKRKKYKALKMYLDDPVKIPIKKMHLINIIIFLLDMVKWDFEWEV